MNDADILEDENAGLRGIDLGNMLIKRRFQTPTRTYAYLQLYHLCLIFVAGFYDPLNVQRHLRVSLSYLLYKLYIWYKASSSALMN
uniref:Uncharacterized protein n=1 Tax=Wuchereria bancrofti TaxID=6293 RepID=A0A1I8EJW5_WUCBA